MNTRAVCLCAGLLLAFGSTELVAQIVLEQTIPGRPTHNFKFDIDGPTQASAVVTSQDFTGDGKPDIALFKTDPQGNVTLAIVDAADYTVWRQITMKNVPYQATLHVMGFYNLDPDIDHKEIVIAQKRGQRYLHPMVIDVDGNLLWDGSGKVLLGVAQMDGDICEEIVAADPTVPQVEVHGKEEDSTRTALKWHR